MVTYMVLWMRRHARDLKGDLEAAAGSALASGSARALVMMAFLAVLREGFETVVFLLATFRASGNATRQRGRGRCSASSWRSSSATASTRAGCTSTWRRFFRVTGVVLVVIAAGLVMTAVHTANEAGWLELRPDTRLFDLSWLVRPGTAVSSLVTGVLGIQPYPVWSKASPGWSTWFPCSSSCLAPARPPAAARRRSDPIVAAPSPTTERATPTVTTTPSS